MKVVFLDRDGVINVEKNYLYKTEDFQFIDGTFEALKKFISQGYAIVIVTNQAGIGRGFYTEEQYYLLTQHYLDLLAIQDIHVAAVYYCPHHPLHGIGIYLTDCTCRKPHPGMLLKAKESLNIDMNKSLLFGDKISDIIAGKRAGVGKCYLVRSGHAFSDLDSEQADGVYNLLLDYLK
ncbi:MULTISPECIES: D-glycero-beta-D-manno-heptose 1,7-bisphosphate 7-phosphatase [unclassified Shewanella]|uniref:D-glycero-beta-D-manno-heptose 1,7-bisphosphate 7-phosphatase n=1 Tax=unclassified Shewanella TaxID=196818 RepID=UPI0021D88371|nr:MULTISPECIES: D-glycero-beta-D-manno-heptose 1,7-bisphosphate 7-phosphatase [unclassified Shewanella]MCU8034056.1 D-glycero-beta-D-manno-heptose 1,7-bisphosphate 7-phosphatase [Shewanella sp. SM71]MCU8095965.1 D-glycero-beta-D-manno-heptose 1,7-bisphosphate 7-phosphatase [Shewanella sp. SM102]